ncbi:hypothetical protein DdX_16729 [Ditylenchus destructor]|uniref:Uncharacterized protein n=1 Tax=Ditylenchus destructor TaxID=166010 RepID=A0AAD4MNH1_9BILA|nr:hypothetical protein DdX_16729 [Ditylenchus destructor]
MYFPCIIEDSANFNGSDPAVDICVISQIIGDTAPPYLTHFSFIPALTVIFLTLIDKNTEDVKWFTFNTAVIIVINSILYETQDVIYETFLQNLDKRSPILHIWYIGQEVTQCPIFMLAATRAFILYWPDTYKKFFSRFLFFWIFAGDALLVFLLFVSSEQSTVLQILDYDVPLSKFLNTAFSLVLLTATFSCLFSVLYQIRKMAKEVAHNTQLAVYDALRRASFVCLFQATFYSMYTFMKMHMLLYNLRIITQEVIILYVLGRIFYDLEHTLFLLFIVLDMLIPLALIKSYRSTTTKLYSTIRGRIFGQKTTSVILVSSTRS